MGPTSVMLNKYVKIICLQLIIQIIAIQIKHYVYPGVLKLIYIYSNAQYICIGIHTYMYINPSIYVHTFRYIHDIFTQIIN